MNINFNSRINQSQHNPIEPHKKPLVDPNVTKNLEKIGKKIERYGITATGFVPLPFSSRWIVSSLIYSTVKTPITLIRSGGQGLDKLKTELTKDWDWSKGIQDLYIDLEIKGDLSKIYHDNIRYAAYMYKGIMDADYHNAFIDVVKNAKQTSSAMVGIFEASSKTKLNQAYHLALEKADPTVNSYNEEGGNGILYTPQIDNYKLVPKQIRKTLIEIADQLKKLGFKVDSTGNFYDTKTGSSFNLIYDNRENEVVVCFMGLGNERFLNISQQEKEKINKASILQIVAESVGAIPSSVRQAIKIGKMLKNLFGITPVLVGHSHGGALAQAAGGASGIKTVVFNSQPLGAGTRRYIGQDKIEKNADKITVFSVKGDWLSDSKALNYLTAAWERATGMALPRTVGNLTYNIPNVKEIELEDDSIKNIENLSRWQHGLFYESLNELKKNPRFNEKGEEI